MNWVFDWEPFGKRDGTQGNDHNTHFGPRKCRVAMSPRPCNLSAEGNMKGFEILQFNACEGFVAAALILASTVSQSHLEQ